MSYILTCNAGSSNTKLAAFDAITCERKGHAVIRDNPAELTEWLCSIGSLGIAAIGHRVVHGGREFSQPILITEEVLSKLGAYIPLAPLHQPANLKLIEETRRLYPQVPQIACFDTGFHRTMAEVERLLPLPRQFYDEGIMRYGFHGLSYQHIASVLPELAGKQARGRVIVAHLGGGSSACAMKDLKSVASTMGFSTLEGLMMSTRCGAIDPGVILYLLQERGMSAEQVSSLLYEKSGLNGVSGLTGDMKKLLEDKNESAERAVELFCYLASKQIAGLLPSIGGLDMLVFTGGIGENAAAVRERIVNSLRWIGDFPVYVIPTDEEAVIADYSRAFLKDNTRK